jgi:hypothetical protein
MAVDPARMKWKEGWTVISIKRDWANVFAET